MERSNPDVRRAKRSWRRSLRRVVIAVDGMIESTGNYRRFRKNRQALRTLERKINTAVDELEAKIVDVTKRQKEYLK